MSSWLDRWARRAAEGTPTTAPEVTAPARSDAGYARRDFLKKAGIVGGVAWSVPVLQTVMAPAHAASNTLINGTCNDFSPCANNTAYCNGFICGGLGATCGLCQTSPVVITCSNSTCGGAGATCTVATQTTTCVSGLCDGTTCKTKAGAACTDDTQCASGLCGTNGTGVCLGAGQAKRCTADGDCLSGSCKGNPAVCDKSTPGEDCWVDGDCSNNKLCNNPVPNRPTPGKCSA